MINESYEWYISQLMGKRLAAEVNKAMQEKRAAMQRKKEFDQHANETINNWVAEMKEHATAQEKQPLGVLGRACLMFKILTNIDMTEQQAEKFLDLVKVCEGHTNEQRN